MPEILLSASSSGSTADVTISSGLAPGSCTKTLTVAGSALGNRSTPRSRNEKMPSTTSDITSIVAKTGRRTHSSESDIAAPLRSLFASRAARSRLDLCAVREVVDVGDHDRRAGGDAVDDLDALPEPVAELHFDR